MANFRKHFTIWIISKFKSAETLVDHSYWITWSRNARVFHLPHQENHNGHGNMTVLWLHDTALGIFRHLVLLARADFKGYHSLCTSGVWRYKMFKFEQYPFMRGWVITDRKWSFLYQFLVLFGQDNNSTNTRDSCAIFSTYMLSSKGIPFWVCDPQMLKGCLNF